MKSETLYVAAAAAICAAWLITPASTQARDNHVNLSIRGESAETCAALEVHSSGSIARAAESFTLPAGSNLEIDGGSRGRIRVRGWDQPGYAIEACRFAAAETQSTADQALKSMSVTRSGSRLAVTGGSGDDRAEGLVYFMVRAPKQAALDLETRNGPISVAGVGGVIKARAGNGPVSVSDCDGEIQVRANNGPISFSGNRGNVSLTAHNGPLSLNLSGSEWMGQGLEARTANGPVSLKVADTFHSGVRIETSGRAPLACRAAMCGSAHSEGVGQGNRSMQLNGSHAVVRVSTENGPVSISSPGRAPKMV